MQGTNVKVMLPKQKMQAPQECCCFCCAMAMRTCNASDVAIIQGAEGRQLRQQFRQEVMFRTCLALAPTIGQRVGRCHQVTGLHRVCQPKHGQC
jgi:hypothetical protein